MDHSDRVLEDLIHQLRGPLIVAVSRVTAVLSHIPYSPLERELRAVRGLCAKANRVAASAGLFAQFHAGNESLSINAVPIPRHELMRMLIESSMDAEALIDPIRELTFHVERHSVDTAELVADPILLTLAVQNLLDNAAKYSYPGTVVNIRVKRTRRSAGVEVTNTGIPIRPADTKNCIERGWRGDEARLVTAEGSGIGLWVTDHIMRAHGGRLEITPTSTEGLTRIALLLPVAELST